ncbi:MAG: tRNA (N(6)-L-threonylcarbamoyladenosine(37)-C(2))-methylthiotransferase MtaB [Bdellovibrio sp.]|nr:tRNA (N(6)-L-threonylcarbamoyladenosine(37)-C(2))-methylthiotransferase MtaB [Bdellovibrio sp.]
MDHAQLAITPTHSLPKDARYEFVVHTFGCKVNTYDTGLIQKNLTSNGFTPDTNKKSTTAVHVLNTCAVTAEATQQAVRLIRKIKSQQPLATIVVTGCAAQVDTGAFENLPGANLVVANSHKGMLPQLLDQYFRGELKDKVFKSNIFKKEDLEIGGGEELQHTRSFLKIQDGCNSFCTFCIIPYARGKSRSIPIAQLVQKINELTKDGVKEVVLTGVHIGDYEDQSFSGLQVIEDLVETVLAKTTIPRIRLSSLEPIELSPRLLALYKNDRLCPHFHMSIQSADTEVLAQMKRKYTEAQVRDSLHSINAQVKNAYVGMDVIAGFPSETDAQFENTYQVLSETAWTRLHVFPYSERQGTRAAVLAQLPMAKRKERASRLRELSLHREQSEALKQIGTTKKALVLNKLMSSNQALSRDYWTIDLGLTEDTHALVKNTEVEVKITSVEVRQMNVVLKAQVLA